MFTAAAHIGVTTTQYQCYPAKTPATRLKSALFVCIHARWDKHGLEYQVCSDRSAGHVPFCQSRFCYCAVIVNYLPLSPLIYMYLYNFIFNLSWFFIFVQGILANNAIHKTVIFDKTVANPKGGGGGSEKPMFHVYPHNKLVIIQLDERDRAIC